MEVPDSSGVYCDHDDVCKCLGERDDRIAELEGQLVEAKEREDEADKQVEWWCNLVQRAAIGTEKTPSLADYVTQLEAIVDKLPKDKDGLPVVPGSVLLVDPVAYRNANPGLIGMTVVSVNENTVSAIDPAGRQRELVPGLWGSLPSEAAAADL